MQKPRRSDRPKVRARRTKKWAEGSIWSEVCAITLGLIAEPPHLAKECQNPEGTRAYKKKCFLVKKRASGDGRIEKKLKFKKLPKIDSPSISNDRSNVGETEKLLNDFVSNDHLYARTNPSNFHNEARGTSEGLKKNVEKMTKPNEEKSIVYNPFNAFQNSTDFRSNEQTCEISKKFNDPSSAREAKKKKSALTTVRRDKVSKRFLHSEKENYDLVLCKKTSIKKKSKKSRKRERPKILQKLEHDEYEESDMDESLLVNPSTDLPQSLLGTIDENISMCNPEFDVGQDLNFESDKRFSSSFESIERDLLKNNDEKSQIFKDKPLSETRDENANIKKRFKKATRSSSVDVIHPQRRLRSATIVCNGTKKSLLENQQNDCDKIRPRRLRRSGEDTRVSAKVETAPEEKLKSEKRRRSADDFVMSKKTFSSEGKQNIDKNSMEDQSGRVTRLSTRNSMTSVKAERREIGTVVWGNCMGWWPGLIVNPEDVGMLAHPEKVWVCWIGEYRISHLREKTQIQSFSTCLHERMIETLKSRSHKDLIYKACMETMELLNTNLWNFGPITKPHYVWAERHLRSLENLDHLILHPYPPEVGVRLDELKETNWKVTEKYLMDQKISAEKASAKSINTIKVSTIKNTFVPMPGHLPLNKQKPGVIAWAKIMGQVWWPAVIVDYRDLSIKEPSFGCQWIVWYGDYTMSQVNHQFFLSFENGMSLMREYAKNCKRECYRRGVVDAAKDYCSRYGYKTEDWQMEQVFAWFEANDEDTAGNEKLSGNNILPGIPGSSEINKKYPSRVLEVLRKHKGNCTVAAARENMIQESEALRLVEAGTLKIDDLCLMCLEESSPETKSTEHPYFFGKLCEECSEKYKPTIFAYGEDGKCFFCTVCAGSDTVVMCDAEDCPRVYCTACIKYLVAPNFYNEILMQDPWMCFLCERAKDSSSTGGSLQPRCDWKDQVSQLFRTNRESVPEKLELYKNGKRKLRVLSLFDGISAGLVVLKKLGIQVEVYYASEIDPDAEMVSSAHHGQEIERLGDVRSISEDKMRKILPIDLLIGGSPCNDLSLVNPLRLGLHDPNGTGVLVFEYCRIKNFLEKHNGHHFFWLFENVASMPSKYRNDITQHLGREPQLIDSAHYSPQHRPRLYWSNLPIVSFPLSTQDLQDVLNPNCNRHALVKKIRTVTTRVNSLKQGRDALKPILMNETNDTLWITELEEIFGFPKHYTDVKNLCATKRQKLIAMSWSVQTIMEIMRPLCNFFYTRNDESP